jgi:hypothetical protein
MDGWMDGWIDGWIEAIGLNERKEGVWRRLLVGKTLGGRLLGR